MFHPPSSLQSSSHSLAIYSESEEECPERHRRTRKSTCFPFPSSVQFSCSVWLTLCDPMNHSTPGLPVHHQHPEFTQTHIHRVGDTIQPSHPLSSPSPPAPNPSQHQGFFQWVNSSHEVAKVWEFQLQHQSFQWTRGARRSNPMSKERWLHGRRRA